MYLFALCWFCLSYFILWFTSIWFIARIISLVVNITRELQSVSAVAVLEGQ